MIKKVAFVGQPTRDFATAKRFYGEVLGLRHDHDHGDKWTEFITPDGVTIALDGYGPELTDTPTPYLSLELDDLGAALPQIEAGGAEVIAPMQINRNAEGREICRIAVILDPMGNPVMLHQIAAWRA